MLLVPLETTQSGHLVNLRLSVSTTSNDWPWGGPGSDVLETLLHRSLEPRRPSFPSDPPVFLSSRKLFRTSYEEHPR